MSQNANYSVLQVFYAQTGTGTSTRLLGFNAQNYKAKYLLRIKWIKEDFGKGTKTRNKPQVWKYQKFDQEKKSKFSQQNPFLPLPFNPIVFLQEGEFRMHFQQAKNFSSRPSQQVPQAHSGPQHPGQIGDASGTPQQGSNLE